jgi:arsenate reductase
MYKMYGIPNCNTVKKARTALENKGLEYEFINFKKQPPTATLIKEWKAAFGDWPANTKGPTYRKIKEDFQAANAAAKTKLLVENSSAIKRPILVKKDKVVCFGFDEEKYEKLK